MTNAPRDAGDTTEARTRILDAAFHLFMEAGYAATSTLQIATRARVSKRELYALVGNKQEILMECIRGRAKRMQVPTGIPTATDRETFAKVLTSFGTQILSEITDPAVVAVFRLAIAEAVQAPEVARTLDAIGRETIRTALREIMTEARAAGLLDGRPNELAEQFGTLLWGNLMVGLLLGVDERPSPREVTARASAATAAFLQLNPPAADSDLRSRKRSSS